MSDTQGAESGAESTRFCASYSGVAARSQHIGAPIFNAAMSAIQRLESEVTRLRAELGEANKRARIAEEDADRLAANGFHEEVCGQGEGVYHGCYDGCGWGKALWEHRQAAATRPPAERAKGEGGGKSDG